MESSSYFYAVGTQRIDGIEDVAKSDRRGGVLPLILDEEREIFHASGMRSSFAAQMKSFSDSPLIAWVVNDARQ